jgi:hypothetical protein
MLSWHRDFFWRVIIEKNPINKKIPLTRTGSILYNKEIISSLSLFQQLQQLPGCSACTCP